jgi:GTP-binding protein LepA
METIRNFAIIAHVDHGKSTLADRLMELTGTVRGRVAHEQELDSHPISRERGITIRLAPVTLSYLLNSKSYTLNLIDTPGHVDFSYEVERSLAACEGVVLLVDATQGIQAQTLSHFHKAQKLGLKIIPAVNKIDLPNARINETVSELGDLTSQNDILPLSAKTGQGVKELLEKIIAQIPPPRPSVGPPRALIFSSQYDPQRGAVAYIRVFDGEINQTDTLYFMAAKRSGSPLQLGRFTPQMTAGDRLSAGEVGYVITNIKDPSLIKIGDTITTVNQASVVIPLPGYQDPKPMVFVSVFPVDQDDYYPLQEALKKLKLNDAAISFTPTASRALGRGFKCGFLGHLHAEVAQERLEEEFGLSLIATAPTVDYKTDPAGNGPTEPWVLATIISLPDYLGAIIQLCEERRGKQRDLKYHGRQATLVYELPLAEIITDFFDQLKAKSSGYASIDYELLGYRPFAAVELEVLINHQPVDALSQTMEKSRAVFYGRKIVDKLQTVIPRAQFSFPIQAAINGEIIARADIPAFRKDVTAKLYGGDRTRKDKLLEAQKKGKKKLKIIGRVELPGDIFLKIFKT